MEGYTYFFTYNETKLHKKRKFWGMRCAMGCDMSQGDDFCAFTFLFPLPDGSFGVKTRSYITRLTYDRLPRALREKYMTFINEGSLIVMEGIVLNIDTDVFDDLDKHIIEKDYDICSVGYDPYNAAEFIDRWEKENGPFGIVKVPQGVKTETVPLGELKLLAEERMLLFDEEIMKFTMGNCIALEDTNGNRKLFKKRREEKIDNVAAMLDAYVSYKLNKESFE
jgi:phage terminase large subunit-like protein